MKTKNLTLAGLLIIGTFIGASGSAAAASIQNSILGASTEIGQIDDIDGIQQQSTIATADQDRTDGSIRAKGINNISIIDESDISNSSPIAIGRIIDGEIQANQIGDDSIEIAA